MFFLFDGAKVLLLFDMCKFLLTFFARKYALSLILQSGVYKTGGVFPFYPLNHRHDYSLYFIGFPGAKYRFTFSAETHPNSYLARYTHRA